MPCHARELLEGLDDFLLRGMLIELRREDREVPLEAIVRVRLKPQPVFSREVTRATKVGQVA